MTREHFIEFLLQAGVLKLGQFTLKSGRVSPYFFNAGEINTGMQISQLARAYAATIANSTIGYDVMFGPAYKGIPLVATTAMALAEFHQIDVPFVYNRKEKKDHGEGGRTVGAELKGKVLIVDDVITAGTAVREAIQLIKAQGAEPTGIIVALDRMEKGQGKQSAIQEIEHEFGIPVISIITLNDIIDYLAEREHEYAEILNAMRQYRSQYGVEY
ncbi:MAG TPA: orotate phosphoribosyltransferase [Piscirickettsiaceae bacterium]|nr:orotate phosphoribosyltransferase [Piscirickettsiaceae bacterium]HIQ40431.1 orotate phosphoribosyltransferase [Sulfurivirga caldicuralii]